MGAVLAPALVLVNVMACRIHRRGNAPCPHMAQFVVRWVPNASAAHHITRDVCGVHLVQAIEQALQEQPRGMDTVEVGAFYVDDAEVSARLLAKSDG